MKPLTEEAQKHVKRLHEILNQMENPETCEAVDGTLIILLEADKENGGGHMHYIGKMSYDDFMQGWLFTLEKVAGIRLDITMPMKGGDEPPTLPLDIPTDAPVQ